MKTQQWQLKKSPEPRTLADVESSRESPVLCWWNDCFVKPCFVTMHGLVKGLDRNGHDVIGSSPQDHRLYIQPSRPTKLEDVPDRRVIMFQPVALRFRDGGIWKDLTGNERRDTHAGDWQLTDCVVELVETEVGVVG